MLPVRIEKGEVIMDDFTATMILLMRCAHLWRIVLKRTSFPDFWNYHWHWFTESDGLREEDVRWAWDHPQCWL